MKVQRILEITRQDATERIAVSSAIEMFSLLHNEQVNRVDMVWDSVLGEKRMTFKAMTPDTRITRRRGAAKPLFPPLVRTVHCGMRPPSAK